MNLKKILKTIQENKTFLISTHVNPDPDALASELVMADFLKKLRKRVYIINADDVPRRYSFLPGIHRIKKYVKNLAINYDVVIIMDCGDLDRIDKVKNLIVKDKMIINLDHHITNTLFGHLNLIAPKSSSTAEILFDFLKFAKHKLTKKMAILLYTGIMTDTGSFRYDSTTEHTHEVVGDLMKFKFSISELYKRMYERVSLSDFRLFTKVLNNFRMVFNGRAVFVELRKSNIKKFSEEFDLKDKIFTFLRTIKGVIVIVILSEHKQNLTRVNFRSQGNTINVSKLAHYFGGGGHRKASGCMIDAPIAQARRRLLLKLEHML